MADIQSYLDAIENAVYGEDVRGSIHDAIEIINDVGEKVITAGTAVTSPSSSVEGFFEDSLYFNTNTDDLWQCTGTGWTLLGNLKGSQGNPGNPGQAATIAVGTVTKGDNASVVNSGTSSAAVFDFVLPKGDPGPAGVNTWGSLTGNIGNQTDLANALDGTYLGAEAAIDATVGWVSSNLASDMDASGGIANGKVTVTKDTGTALVYNEASYANSGARIKLYGIPKNKDCKLTFTATEGSGGAAKIGTFAAYWLEGGYIVSSTISKTVTQTGDFYEISFNSGNDPYEYIGIDLYCTGDAASVGSVTYSEIMVRDADAPYKGYSQMHKPVTDVITDVYGVMGENGAKNSLQIPSSVVTTTINGITFTVTRNSAGQVTEIDANGVNDNTDASRFYILGSASTFVPVQNKAMIANGCNGGSASTYCLVVHGNNSSSGQQAEAHDIYDGDEPIGAYPYYRVYVLVKKGASVDHVKFYPMFRDARDTNPDYVPYAMTNRELTEKVTPLVSGMLPQLLLSQLYGGTSANAINIDTINKPNGYVYRVITGSYFSGTAPTGFANGFIIIGFSSMVNGNPEYGAQLAIGYGDGNVAFRRAPYNASGGSWGAWKNVSFAS